jgi:hypothetical protein
MTRATKVLSARGRRLVLVVALASLGVLLTACSGSPQAATTTSTTTSTVNSAGATTTSIPTPQITSATVTIAGHRYTVPTAGGRPIDTYESAAGQIVLTDKGFLPYRSLAALKQVITWTNLSSKPVRLVLLHVNPDSGANLTATLSVGGTFHYSSSTLINFGYESSTGYHGVVSIGAFQT